MSRNRSFRHLPLTRRIVLAAFAATPLLVAGNAQALQIDDFNGADFICAAGGPNICSVTPVPYGGAVGGFRAAWFIDTGGFEDSTLSVGNGVFEHNTRGGGENGTSQIAWEGGGQPLGDFTDGGASDRIQLMLEIDDLSPLDPSPSMLFFIGTAGPSGVVQGQIEFTVDESGIVDVPMDDSWTVLGGQNPLDFTEVVFLRLQISPMNNDFTVSIDNIATVPEPGTAALLGLGLTGLAAVGRSRRQGGVRARTSPCACFLA